MPLHFLVYYFSLSQCALLLEHVTTIAGQRRKQVIPTLEAQELGNLQLQDKVIDNFW